MTPAKRPARKPPETVTIDSPLTGRDEMNLAEFPLSVLTDRAPKTTKTLVFTNQHGSLTITSSDAYGLPTPLDADVMVALIQLTKQKNDFQERIVNFTRYELLRLLGWPNEGKSYRRLAESLHRWHGVSLIYDGCWWDNRAKQWGNADIHIIESVIMLEGTAKAMQDGIQQSLPLSSFEWNRRFIESCQANNLKYLDLSFYFSLEHHTSKVLYRFLDKRFYLQPEWVFDLSDIALERVGLSRNYADAGKLKEKLQPAIEELEDKGFLQPMSREGRYFKEGKVWKIRLAKLPLALDAPQPAQQQDEPEPPLATALASHGVSPDAARALVQKHDEHTIRLQIEILEWRLAGKKAGKIDDPAAWLVSAIKHPHTLPKGFIPKADREKKAEAARQRQQAEAEDRRRQQEEAARERAETQAINAYWTALTSQQQAELDAAANAAADPAQLALEDGPLKRIGQQLRRNDHIRRLLKHRQNQPAEA